MAAGLCLIASFIGTAQAETKEFPPRGAEIGVLAGNCDVGPFGKSGDTGAYTGLCKQLTGEEICLAYFKGHFKDDGEMIPAYDTAKAKFCSNKLILRLSETN